MTATTTGRSRRRGDITQLWDQAGGAAADGIRTPVQRGNSRTMAPSSRDCPNPPPKKRTSPMTTSRRGPLACWRWSCALPILVLTVAVAGCGGTPQAHRESAVATPTPTAAPTEDERAGEAASDFLLALQDQDYAAACHLGSDSLDMWIGILGRQAIMAEQLEAGERMNSGSDRRACAAGMESLSSDWGVQFAEPGRTRRKDEWTIQVEIKSAGEPLTVEMSSHDDPLENPVWKVADLIGADGQRYLDMGVPEP
jgi:hypothetical protein